METYEPTKQTQPMRTMVRAGLRNASTDQLIEELEGRELDLDQIDKVQCLMDTKVMSKHD